MISLALLLSSLTLPPLELDTDMMPELLIQAQSQGVGRPETCIQLSQEFLQRQLLDTNYAILDQNPNGYREAKERYRTRQQSTEASLIQSACLTRLDQYETAANVLNRALREAVEQKNGFLEAVAHYQLASNALESNEDLSVVRAHLVKMQEVINLQPGQVKQLPYYAALLRTAYAIKARQFALATQSLASLTGEEPISGDEVSNTVQAAALLLKGDLFYVREQDELALAYYSDALKMAAEQQDMLTQARLTDKISALFMRQGNIKQAIEYLELSCDQFQQVGNPSWLAQGLVKLATLNRQKGDDNNLALSLLFNALDLYHNLNRPLELAHLNLEIGKTYLRMNSLDAARPYLAAARNSYRLYHSAEGQLETMLTEAELHLQEHDPALAIKLLESSPESGRKGHEDPRIFLLLSRAYEEKGQYQNALNNYQRFFNAHQRNEHDSARQGTHEFTDNYQQMALEKRNKTLVVEQEALQSRNRLYLWSCIAAGVIILLLAATLLWQRLLQRRWQLRWQQLKEQEFCIPLTTLPNQRQLDEDLQRWQQEIREGEQTASHYFYHLHIPLFDDLIVNIGGEPAARLFQSVGHALQQFCGREMTCYQLACGRFLLVQHNLTLRLPRQVAEDLIKLLSSTLQPYEKVADIGIGMVGHPFLTRCPESISTTGVVELSLLALAAAKQIAARTGMPSWVELSAIDCQQAAFFNGEIRGRALQAIDMGLVKVNAREGKQWIDWSKMTGV